MGPDRRSEPRARQSGRGASGEGGQAAGKGAGGLAGAGGGGDGDRRRRGGEAPAETGEVVGTHRVDGGGELGRRDGAAEDEDLGGALLGALGQGLAAHEQGGLEPGLGAGG